MLREARFLTGATPSTAYTAASNAAWAAGTATKMRIQSLDDGGLVREVVKDATTQQRHYSSPAVITTTRKGSFSLSMFLGAAESDLTANPMATLLSKILGGIALPLVSRTDACDSSGVHTSTRVFASGIESSCVVGQGIKVGTRGDAKGNAEVRRVTALGTDYVDLNMALSAAPADGDAITFATTVYLDPDTVQYFDWLLLGHATADQRQAIGCQATGLALTGTGIGELPSVNATFSVADWQWVPSGDRDQLEPTAAAQGNDPPVDRGLMGLFLGDFGVTTRTAFRGGPIDIPNLGASFTAIQGYNGRNGIDGWARVPFADGLTATLSLHYDEDMPGIYDDLTNGTAKQLIFQMGHADQKCAAVDYGRCFVSSDPVPDEIDGLSGIKFGVTATEDTLATNDLTLSACRIHFF